METKTKRTIGLITLLVLLLAATVVVWLLILWPRYFGAPAVVSTQVITQPPAGSGGQQQRALKEAGEVEIDIVPVTGAEELHSYMQYYSEFGRTQYARAFSGELGVVELDEAEQVVSSDGRGPTRYSDTNVQVLGVDEPDIVKSNGRQIFIAPELAYRYAFFADVAEKPGARGGESLAQTSVIEALPPKSAEVVSRIEVMAETILLYDDTLLTLTDDTVTAFDVSVPATPEQVWEMVLQDGGQIETARLLDGQLVLVTSSGTLGATPCPFTPAEVNGVEVKLSCGEVLRPTVPVAATDLYVLFSIDVETGEVASQNSLAARTYDSAIMVSNDYLYLTYPLEQDKFKMMQDFYETIPKIVGDDFLARLKEIDSYDLHASSKYEELQREFIEMVPMVTESDTTDLNEALALYRAEHSREIIRTGIAQFNLADLSLAANGVVPGALLNQFSIDEYEGYLRVATTVGVSTVDTVNDLYVLDEELEIVGSVKDLGDGERIYATRFVDGVGYMVTFREIDPFFVFDLSDPVAPRAVGQLKIPGYSSYLHPIDETTVLGVGKNDKGKVKLSLFDLSDPTAPVESAKAVVDAVWSDVLTTHTAFLLDSDNEVFFLPAGEDGLVYTYAGGDLKLVKAVEDVGARRAVYIADYLFIVGSSSVTVLDEKNWKTVATIELTTKSNK